MVREGRRRVCLLGLVLAALALILTGTPGHTPVAEAGTKLGPPVAVHTDISGAITVEQDGQPMTRQISGSADVNFGPDRSLRLHFEIDGVTGFDLVVVGGTVYMQADDSGWQIMPVPPSLQEVGVGGMESVENSAAQLQEVEQAGIQVTMLPDEVLNGVDVHHLQATATGEDLQRMLAMLPPTVTAGLNAGEIPSGPNTAIPANAQFTFDQWTGVDDNFTYRTAFAFVIDGFSLQMTMDNLPLSEPVPITAPI